MPIAGDLKQGVRRPKVEVGILIVQNGFENRYGFLISGFSKCYNLSLIHI